MKAGRVGRVKGDVVLGWWRGNVLESVEEAEEREFMNEER